jgi:flagellar hook-associated protein 1 FlgK
MASFYGLEIAKTGLFASQRALYVTGHNISNANTVGYTRQRLTTSAIPPAYGNTKFAPVGKGKVGGGVEIEIVKQIRDAFLDMQYREETQQLGEWSSRADALRYIEDIFREPSDSGINTCIAELFNSFQELAKHPESYELRTIVRQEAIKLTETLGHYHSQLEKLQGQQRHEIEVTTMNINTIAENIKGLNDQIFKFEINGHPANDLRDKRNLLIDELSELINIEYGESPSGEFSITIDGEYLVNHTDSFELVEDADGFRIGSEEIEIVSGKLKGCLQMRDGDSENSIGIPYFIEKLDDIAKALVFEFTSIHRDGYTLPINGTTSETGINFFVYDGYDETEPFDINALVAGVTASNIQLSTKIAENVEYIAASSNPIDVDNPLEIANSKNIDEICKLRDSKEIEFIGSYEGFLKSVIADLAVETSHAEKMLEGQNILIENIQFNRESTSGVSIDEEMTQMIRYQHSYAAASRMITTIDEALDTLINRTGIVGR